MKPLRIYLCILCAITAIAMILTVFYPYLLSPTFGEIEYKELLRRLIVEFGALVAFLILLMAAFSSPDSKTYQNTPRKSPG